MRDVTIEPSKADKATPVGTPWWRRALVDAQEPTTRREALGALLAGGALAGLAVALQGCEPWVPPNVPASDDLPPSHLEQRPALAVQKERGWNFGAEFEELAFNGEVAVPFYPAVLTRLVDELRPARVDLRPYYVPTLFQAPLAFPTAVQSAELEYVNRLWEIVRPIYTTAMRLAYRRGQSLAASLSRAADVALVIDLPGPEAVAFAAGAASGFDPVFTFDNWPHPHQIVPAHLTLAAALYFQPLFAKAAVGPRRRPMFVLDRNRLAPYAESSIGFDNRYVARLPGAEALGQLAVRRVLYVTPEYVGTEANETHEMDDLNDDFVAYAESGIDVRIIAAAAFYPEVEGDDNAPCYYLGGAAGEMQFWADYPWFGATAETVGLAHATTRGRAYVPSYRFTMFSCMPLPERPCGPFAREGFGTVQVLVNNVTGAIVVPTFPRSGSWTRASGMGGG